MVGKRRAVIICHPDFDAPGAAGIQQAKDFATTMLIGQKEMISAAEKSGEPKDQIAKVRKHTKAYQIVIRSLEEDII